MPEIQESELVEYEGQHFEITLFQEVMGKWGVAVTVRGQRAGTTRIPFSDKSEARNYALAVGKSELSKFRKL